MSQSSDQISLTVKRFALLTCCVALLPISIGALVTTLKAGMAFADWPTSDGQNMLLYPWLNDLRNTDKFVEHGHRLAGMLIGFVSIGLVLVTFSCQKQRWVRTWSVAILIAVIGQGLLGGMRVRMDAQKLAMIHSITGGLFFTMCFVFALVVRRPDEHPGKSGQDTIFSPVGVVLAVMLPIAVISQYVLGGFFRHLGTMLHEHLAGAIVVTLLTVCVIPMLARSELAALNRRAKWLTTALLVQVSLGMGSWVTKLGFPAFGWVASTNSLAQNITCSLHTVGGMFLLATSTAAAVELCLTAKEGRLNSFSSAFTAATHHKPSEGGAA